MSVLSKLLERFSGRTTQPPTKTAGAPGFSSWSGILSTNERDSRVVGARRWETYEDLITNVSIVAAGSRYFLNLLSQPDWKVEPADDSDEAKRAADLVEDCIYDMRRPWNRVVRRAALFRFWGFGFQEWTAKRRPDGMLGLLDIAPRPAHTIERWDVDETGAILGVVQRRPQDGTEVYLPRGKLIYCVDDALTDHPEGTGLLRHIVEPVERLRRYEGLENTGFVTDLRGLPMVRAPLDRMQQQVTSNQITEADRTARINVLMGWLQDHVKSIHGGLMLDSDTYRSEGADASPSANPLWDVKVINGGSVGLEEINVAINRVTYEIARVLGVEHLLLGSDGTGSLALSQTKSHDFALTVDSTLSDIVETIRSDVVVPICDLNGVPDHLRPWLSTEAIQHQNPAELTAALRDMATAGAPLGPGDPAINEVRAILGLSEAPEDLDMLDASLLEETDAAGPPPGRVAPAKEQATQEDDIEGEGAKAPEEDQPTKKRIKRGSKR